MPFHFQPRRCLGIIPRLRDRGKRRNCETPHAGWKGKELKDGVEHPPARRGDYAGARVQARNRGRSKSRGAPPAAERREHDAFDKTNTLPLRSFATVLRCAGFYRCQVLHSLALSSIMQVRLCELFLFFCD